MGVYSWFTSQSAVSSDCHGVTAGENCCAKCPSGETIAQVPFFGVIA